MSKDVEISALQSLFEIKVIADEWAVLNCEGDPQDTFHTYTWYSCWIKHFGTSVSPLVLAARVDNQLIGLLPLIKSRVKRRPWLSLDHIQQSDLRFIVGKPRWGNFLPTRQLSGPANLESMSIRSSWLAKAGQERSFWKAIATYLNRLKGWDLLVLPAISSERTDSAVTACLTNGLHAHIRKNVISLFGLKPMPWADYLETRTGHFANRARAIERGVQKLGAIEVTATRNKQYILQELHKFFQLGEQSQKQKPRAGQAWFLPLTDSTINFYTDLAEQYASDERCVVHSIKCNGDLIAGLYSLIEGKKLIALLTYFSPAYYKASPGRYLMQALIDWAGKNDIDWIDFNGNSTWVKMFAKEPTTYDQIIISRPLGYGMMLQQFARCFDHIKLRRARKEQ